MKMVELLLKLYPFTITLRAPITTAADDINTYISIVVFFREKIRLGIPCEYSARQMIYTKHYALFSSKDKRKKRSSGEIFIWRSNI